jgi:hypothetical protein
VIWKKIKVEKIEVWVPSLHKNACHKTFHICYKWVQIWSFLAARAQRWPSLTCDCLWETLHLLRKNLPIKTTLQFLPWVPLKGYLLTDCSISQCCFLKGSPIWKIQYKHLGFQVTRFEYITWRAEC